MQNNIGSFPSAPKFGKGWQKKLKNLASQAGLALPVWFKTTNVHALRAVHVLLIL